MMGQRVEWCISRQRVWGVPLPVFYEKSTGKAILNDETFSHIRKLVAEQGTNCWCVRINA